jgi:nucleoside-diphosphate-sugar epimerase
MCMVIQRLYNARNVCWTYRPDGAEEFLCQCEKKWRVLYIANIMQRKLDVRVARIFDTYGPRMRVDSTYGGVVAQFIDQAPKEMPITVFGDGMQTRSFCFVSDMVEGLLRFISADDCEGEVVNMGSEEETSIKELAKEIKRLTNSSSEIVLEEFPEDEINIGRMCPDITKAKRILGWEPKIGLEEGLKKTIEWFEKIQEGYNK